MCAWSKSNALFLDIEGPDPLFCLFVCLFFNGDFDCSEKNRLVDGQVSFHRMTRHPKWRSVGASGTRTGGQTDTADEVGLDWTHPQEASIQHYTPNPDLEPAGEDEERPASQQLEARHWSRAETARDQLIWNGQDSPEQSAMARGRRWPMRWA